MSQHDFLHDSGWSTPAVSALQPSDHCAVPAWHLSSLMRHTQEVLPFHWISPDFVDVVSVFVVSVSVLVSVSVDDAGDADGVGVTVTAPPEEVAAELSPPKSAGVSALGGPDLNAAGFW